MMERKPKVLIVDDVPENIHLFTSMLRKDYTIVAATSGEKAIQIAKKDPKPDVILLDVVMPMMDGYEVCKILKEDPSTKDIPVIFVTSLNSIEDQEKGLEAGGIDFIIKPVSRKIVIHKIQTYVKSRFFNNNEIKSEEKVMQMEESKGTILVVDDAPQNIQVLVEILKNDYRVSVATSGQKALDMLENGLSPDLILLDVLMPDMDGYEVCKTLKENPKYEQVPVIFVTILEHEKDILKGLELGAVDYVVKPVEPTVLKARVNAHMKLKKLQDSLKDDLKSKNELLLEQSKFAVLGEMFENITHQWKQPLSSISLNIGLLEMEKQLGKLDDDRFQSTVDSIRDSAVHLGNTIDDFRDLLGSNQEKKVYILKKLVDKPIKILDSKLEKNSIKVFNNIDSIFAIKGYDNYLLQVLMNLFNNSLEELCNIEKDDKYIKVSIIAEDENNITIEFCDNGRGIPEDKIENIFNKYFTTKEHSGGSGLGLFMSKMIVETKLDGSLTAKNSADGGACFLITIPKS